MISLTRNDATLQALQTSGNREDLAASLLKDNGIPTSAKRVQALLLAVDMFTVPVPTETKNVDKRTGAERYQVRTHWMGGDQSLAHFTTLSQAQAFAQGANAAFAYCDELNAEYQEFQSIHQQSKGDTVLSDTDTDMKFTLTAEGVWNDALGRKVDFRNSEFLVAA